VSAELGQTVREGQTLVEIYSPELAEAERAYLSARADLTLAEQRRQRTERLGGIGAVSQQELEDVRAEYARQTNAVEGARSRLRLMGLSAEAIGALKTSADIGAVITVPAPSAGEVVKRAVNRGQNVDAAMELITIADLSSVWVIADIYERDMAGLRVGATANISSVALPGQTWTGRIAYVDPQVATDTRTLKARIEVANPSRSLKPGMLVDVALGGATGAPQVVIPRAAVQQAGERTLVFTPGANGTFNVREVRLGAISGDRVAITAGLTTSDQVVTDGAFSLKAEWERIAVACPTRPRSRHQCRCSASRSRSPRMDLIHELESGGGGADRAGGDTGHRQHLRHRDRDRHERAES
jgi:cobalt-zinc-cadmium efflux system membrane fusion protein